MRRRQAYAQANQVFPSNEEMLVVYPPHPVQSVPDDCDYCTKCGGVYKKRGMKRHQASCLGDK